MSSPAAQTVALPVANSDIPGSTAGPNAICTSKYTTLSFVPKVLFLQYRKASHERRARRRSNSRADNTCLGADKLRWRTSELAL